MCDVVSFRYCLVITSHKTFVTQLRDIPLHIFIRLFCLWTFSQKFRGKKSLSTSDVDDEKGSALPNENVSLPRYFTVESTYVAVVYGVLC